MGIKTNLMTFKCYHFIHLNVLGYRNSLPFINIQVIENTIETILLIINVYTTGSLSVELMEVVQGQQ